MNNLFKNESCLSANELKAYAARRIGKHGRRRVEQHIMRCTLCFDALEGHQIAARKSEPPLFKIHARRIVRYAAAAAAIIGVSGLAIWHLAQDTGSSLYSEYYHAYRLDLVEQVRSESTTAPHEAELARAQRAYDSGDYATAIDILEQYDGDEVEPARIDFYEGVAHLEAQSYQLAKGVFRKAYRHGKDVLQQDAAWYLSLAHLRLNEIDSARILLQDLVSQSPSYRRDAAELLEKLR